MANLSRSQQIGIVIGLALLAGLIWLIWPFFFGAGEMQTFCQSLETGSTPAQVQALAEQRGYRVTVTDDGHAIVFNPGSFGRDTCSLQFESGRMLTATYSYND